MESNFKTKELNLNPKKINYEIRQLLKKRLAMRVTSKHQERVFNELIDVFDNNNIGGHTSVLFLQVLTGEIQDELDHREAQGLVTE